MLVQLDSRVLGRALTLLVLVSLAACAGNKAELGDDTGEAANYSTPLIEDIGDDTTVTDVTTATATDLATCSTEMTGLDAAVDTIFEDVTTRAARSARRYEVLRQKLTRSFRSGSRNTRACVSALSQDSQDLGTLSLQNRFTPQALSSWFLKIVRWVLAGGRMSQSTPDYNAMQPIPLSNGMTFDGEL